MAVIADDCLVRRLIARGDKIEDEYRARWTLYSR